MNSMTSVVDLGNLGILAPHKTKYYNHYIHLVPERLRQFIQADKPPNLIPTRSGILRNDLIGAR